MSQGFARRRWSSTARAPTPWSAQARRPSVTTSPKSHACLQREAEARLGAGLEGEGNEVADFVDELTERVARRLLRGCAQLLGPAERAVAAIQQGAHVHGRRLGRRRRGSGSGGTGLDGRERGSQGVELGRERFLVTGA